MELIRALRFDQESSAPKVAFVGSGGKTTAIFRAAREFQCPVLVTATSHLALPQLEFSDRHLFADQISALENQLPSGVTLITGAVDGATNRTRSVSGAQLERIEALANKYNTPLLIEADGSRQLPLKAPAEYEPPIPEFVDSVVVVTGLSGLGQPLTADTVHRPEIFADHTGLQPGAMITSDVLYKALIHPLCGLKNIPDSARRIVLLNQADTAILQARAAGLAANLLLEYDAVVISSLQSQTQIYAVHESIAGVVLAAGGASRFGQPKQLLDWHGRPFVWQVAQRALQAGLNPVTVVCGQDIEQIRRALYDLPVKIVHNPEWQTGQGSTIRVGVGATPLLSGGIIFLLADQPQIPIPLLHKLIAEHAQTLTPIIGPLVDGQRANPVLFDRMTFSDLLALSGEVGGRKLFSKYPVRWLPWHDPTPLLDVDTPADYARLLELDL